jgi:two-component system NtrC family sensor kinase
MQEPHTPTSLDATLDRIDACMHTDPEEAIRLCEQVFVEARQSREPLAQVIAAERYGLIMDHLGRHVAARDVLFNAAQAAQSARLTAYEARLLEQIARGYYTAGEYRPAIQYWARCVEVSGQGGHDVRTWILAKIGLGQVYYGLNDYASGLALLADAAGRFHEIDDPHLDAKIKINVGVGLAETQHGKEAATVFHDALEICLEHEFFDYAAESNYRLGQLALADGELDSALDYLEKALPQAAKVSYRWGECNILAIQAEVYACRKEYSLAWQKIEAAKAIATTDGFGHKLIQHYFAAARYAELMGDTGTALAEFRHGYDREQRMLAGTTSERHKDLEEKAGLRPTVSRLLVELANNHLIEEGRLEPAFNLITQEGSRILEVARASIWLLDPQTDTLICRCLYLADKAELTREAAWRRKDSPAYFERLADHNPLVANDAANHPNTWELEKTYLEKRDIKSMLVFPIWLAEHTTGILCFEAVGTQRNWTPDDILHGNQLTEVAARVIASYERKLFQQEISALNSRMMHANAALEARVIERTASLEKHNAELHALNDQLYDMRNKLQQLEKAAAVAAPAAEGTSPPKAE